MVFDVQTQGAEQNLVRKTCRLVQIEKHSKGNKILGIFWPHSILLTFLGIPFSLLPPCWVHWIHSAGVSDLVANQAKSTRQVLMNLYFVVMHAVLGSASFTMFGGMRVKHALNSTTVRSRASRKPKKLPQQRQFVKQQRSAHKDLAEHPLRRIEVVTIWHVSDSLVTKSLGAHSEQVSNADTNSAGIVLHRITPFEEKGIRLTILLAGITLRKCTWDGSVVVHVANVSERCWLQCFGLQTSWILSSYCFCNDALHS